MIETPSATGTNGRFQPGNQAAVGHSSRSQKLRHVMLEAISEDDVRAIVTKLISLAKAGNLGAAKLLLDRTIGKVSVGEPPAGDEPALHRSRDEELSSIFAEMKNTEARLKALPPE